MPGAVWDKNDKKSWRCSIDGYVKELQWYDDSGKAADVAQAYAIENGG